MCKKGNYEIYHESFTCTDKTRILSPEECKKASEEYGYSYLKEVEYIDRPAGCYLYAEGQFKNTFFNTLRKAPLFNISSSHYIANVKKHVKSICHSFEPGMLIY